MSSIFSVSLITTTPIVLGQWLTLDAVLDGVLEADGVEAKERVVPLMAWDGKNTHQPMTTDEIRRRGLVHIASSMLPNGFRVETAEVEEGSNQPNHIISSRPRVLDWTWRLGVRPASDFHDETLPFVDGNGKPAVKFDIKRGPGASKLDNKKLLVPGKIDWVAQGDPATVVEILELAAGIGAKISAGFGRFDPTTIVVEELDDVDPLTGILDPEGSSLWRPVPQAMLEGLDVTARLSVQTCRSPYWDRSQVEPAFIPYAKHYDGLLTF